MSDRHVQVSPAGGPSPADAFVPAQTLAAACASAPRGDQGFTSCGYFTPSCSRYVSYFDAS